jgi:predicted RND superfamily exporter protein
LKSPFSSLADLIIDHSRFVAATSVVVLIIALLGMGFVTMATGSDTYLDKDTKRGMLLDDYTETFQSDSILVLIETDGVLTPPVLAYMDRLGNEIAKEQNVNSVSGITDLLRSANGGVLPVSSAEITRAEQRIPPEVLSRYVPSALSGEQQQGLVPNIHHNSFAAPHGKPLTLGLYPGGSAHPGT